jgi:hypothetical protein
MNVSKTTLEQQLQHSRSPHDRHRCCTATRAVQGDDIVRHHHIHATLAAEE